MATYENRVCKKHGDVPFVLEGRGYYRCTKCRSAAVTKRRINLKEKAVEYKGGRCQNKECGYNKQISALEFHHLDPSQKDFAIGNEGQTRSWQKVKTEIDKCVLLCCRCHREIHAGEQLDIMPM